jgi:hypothetical protein
MAINQTSVRDNDNLNSKKPGSKTSPGSNSGSHQSDANQTRSTQSAENWQQTKQGGSSDSGSNINKKRTRNQSGKNQ